MMVVLLTSVNGLEVLAILTSLAPVKFVPVMVTGVPPLIGPLFGDMPVTVGATAPKGAGADTETAGVPQVLVIKVDSLGRAVAVTAIVPSTTSLPVPELLSVNITVIVITVAVAEY